MLHRILDWHLSLFNKGKRLHLFKPLGEATDKFFREPIIEPRHPPYIRDIVDVKRWVILVVIALIPATLMGIWNVGTQKWLYSQGDYRLIDAFFHACSSFSSYCAFVTEQHRYLLILKQGLAAFLPILILTYTVGGIWEIIFACWRRHPIAEGFLVTGLLYALILPPTLPYWMVAVGISFGIVMGKEIFGGTGMNIVNPALSARCFLFFSFPSHMTGDVWIGTNSDDIAQSVVKMNREAGRGEIDGYSTATPLAKANIHSTIKNIHVDAIAAHEKYDTAVATLPLIEKQAAQWNISNTLPEQSLHQFSPDQFREFLTTPLSEGGLGLSPEHYLEAHHFTGLRHDAGIHSDMHAFLGHRFGCFGETSTIACLLGGIYLVYRGVASWRTMVFTILGVCVTAWLFQYSSLHFGEQGGAWNSARFSLPLYKHFLWGGLSFGLIFMATDPVSSPAMKGAKMMYGFLIGSVVVIIRLLNPAYPEGVMLAILLGNVCAPLFDRIALYWFIKRKKKNYAKILCQ